MRRWLRGIVCLLVMSVVLFAGCSSIQQTGTEQDRPEVRNNGTAIQWKYGSESEWRDLVALADLMGAAGEKGAAGIAGKDGVDGRNGVDGKDGVDGRNGVDGKTVEVRKTDSSIQWRVEGGEWQDLVALSDLSGPSGKSGADGANGKTPEFRVNENTLQWRYIGDEIWLNLYDLSALKGLDGKDGAAGKDGVNGKDGTDGKDGIDGQNGKDGSCPGYFYAEGSVSAWPLQYGSQKISLSEVINKGGLIAATQDGGLTLKKGHTYRVIISGSLGVCSGASDGSGYYGIQLTDSSATPDFCREITRIKRDGVSAAIPYSTDYHSFHFTRLYDASAQDITLKFLFEQSEYDTYIECFLGTITITALD